MSARLTVVAVSRARMTWGLFFYRRPRPLPPCKTTLLVMDAVLFAGFGSVENARTVAMFVIVVLMTTFTVARRGGRHTADLSNPAACYLLGFIVNLNLLDRCRRPANSGVRGLKVHDLCPSIY